MEDQAVRQKWLRHQLIDPPHKDLIQMSFGLDKCG